MARTIYGDHEKYLNTYFRQFPGWVAILAYTEIHVAQVVHSYCNVFQFFCWWCSSSYIQYASKKNYADIQSVFPKCVSGAASAAKRKASSEDMEGFFQTALGSYTYKFLKRGAGAVFMSSELRW